MVFVDLFLFRFTLFIYFGILVIIIFLNF